MSEDVAKDRFGQSYGLGDLVVYGTRVGNVAQTRFAMVTDVTFNDGWTWDHRVSKRVAARIPTVTVKPLQRAGESWVFGRASKPTVSNIVKITLPDSDGIHLV